MSTKTLLALLRRLPAFALVLAFLGVGVVTSIESTQNASASDLAATTIESATERTDTFMAIRSEGDTATLTVSQPNTEPPAPVEKTVESPAIELAAHEVSTGKVQIDSGDTYGKIGNKYHCPWQDIQSVVGLPPTKLRVGLIFDLPKSCGGSATPNTAQPNAPPADTAPASAGSSVKAKAVQAALSLVGKTPYVTGGTSPSGVDCSGLVYWAYKQAGITLPARQSTAMSTKVGHSVSRDQLEPGDLLFYYTPVSHVAMYIGNGKIVTAAQSGEMVKISDMEYKSMPITAMRSV